MGIGLTSHSRERRAGGALEDVGESRASSVEWRGGQHPRAEAGEDRGRACAVSVAEQGGFVERVIQRAEQIPNPALSEHTPDPNRG